MVIGVNIKAARLKAGLTQAQLAKTSGVSQPSIALYENDQQMPVAKSLAAIAKALNVPMDSLVDTDLPSNASEEDNRNHGNSTTAQISKLVVTLNRDAQALVLKQVKMLLASGHGNPTAGTLTETPVEPQPKRRRKAA